MIYWLLQLTSIIEYKIYLQNIILMNVFHFCVFRTCNNDNFKIFIAKWVF